MMQQKRRTLGVMLMTGLSLAAVACGKTQDASDGSGSEIAVAALAGTSRASEGTIAATRARTFLARLESTLTPIPRAWSVPACNWSASLSACVAGAETLTLNGCSSRQDPAIAIRGSQTLTFTGADCCTADPLMASSVTPCSFTRRTLNSSGVADPLVRSLGSHVATLNTEDLSGYEVSKSGGFEVACLGVAGDATCRGKRRIAIVGAHYTGKISNAPWDFTVSTDEPAVVQGYEDTRQVLSGVVRVQHNLLKVTSVTKVVQPLIHQSACCYPVGGEVNTSFTGGKLDGKTETVTFGPGCGEATLNDTQQQKTGLTLHHCL